MLINMCKFILGTCTCEPKVPNAKSSTSDRSFLWICMSLQQLTLSKAPTSCCLDLSAIESSKSEESYHKVRRKGTKPAIFKDRVNCRTASRPNIRYILQSSSNRFQEYKYEAGNMYDSCPFFLLFSHFFQFTCFHVIREKIRFSQKFPRISISHASLFKMTFLWLRTDCTAEKIVQHSSNNSHCPLLGKAMPSHPRMHCSCVM